MINHILVPLDGSTLAECVLPHLKAIAPVTKARVTLIYMLEHPENRNGGHPVRPVGLAHAKAGSTKVSGGKDRPASKREAWMPASPSWRASRQRGLLILPTPMLWI